MITRIWEILLLPEDNFEISKKVYVRVEEKIPSNKIISSETNSVFPYHLERAIVTRAVTIIDINVWNSQCTFLDSFNIALNYDISTDNSR